MKLVVFGDSFPNGLNKPSPESPVNNSIEQQQKINFVTRIGQLLEIEVENYSARGAGNPEIAYRAFDYVRNNACTDAMLLVVWSSFNRPYTINPLNGQRSGVFDIPDKALEVLQDQMIYAVYGLCIEKKIPLLMTNSFCQPEKTHLELNFLDSFDRSAYIEYGKPCNTLMDICYGVWLQNYEYPVHTFDHNYRTQELPDTLSPCWHPNERGHRLIAETLAPYIAQKINIHYESR